jgi:osmotically-inducible protein OsmY
MDEQLSMDLTDSRVTDERLCDSIIRELRVSGYLAVRDAEVSVRDGHASIRGRVPTYYLKQVAQSAAMSVDGIKSIENDLVVC